MDTTLSSSFARLRLPTPLETLASLCRPLNCFALDEFPNCISTTDVGNPNTDIGARGNQRI